MRTIEAEAEEPLNTAVCARCGDPMDPTFVAKIRARRVSLGLPDRSPKICALCVLKAIGLMVGDDDADD